MTNNLESKFNKLSSDFADLPGRYPKEYPSRWSGDYGDIHYRILVNKSGKKIGDVWDDFLVSYFSFQGYNLQQESLKENGEKFNSNCEKFNSHSRNYWFGGHGFEVIDKKNNRKITAHTPWYSFLLRPFFKGDLIIVKIKENYNSLKKAYNPSKKVYSPTYARSPALAASPA